MCIAQDLLLEEKLAPIDRKDIAQALHQRNFDELRLTESIQISPNGRFCFIKFSTRQVMETCTEDLTQMKISKSTLNLISNQFQKELSPLFPL